MKEDAPEDCAPKQPDALPLHLVFCGSSKWDLIGRKSLPKAVIKRGGTEAGEEHLAPTRLTFSIPPLSAVFSGPSAAHLVLLTIDGLAYGLGRNDAAQLAKGDLLARRHPIPMTLPDASPVKMAACGRAHTLLVGQNGSVFGVGENRMGQLGIGLRADLKQPNVTKLSRVQLPESERAVCAAAGSEFSVFACESGAVYCAGSGQYGQLGNGRTGECIEGRSRIIFDVLTKPVRVGGFGSAEGEVRVVQVACGTNHTLALDAEGKVWSWGWGGYGRLGHKTPKDELRPRIVEAFSAPNYKLDMVACGQSSSFAVQKDRKSCYMWGIAKKTGECNMYPKPQFDLQGWEIRSIAAGPTSTVVATERSVISWGGSPTFGELGYGEGQPKSSTKPKVMESVEGLLTKQVAEGMAFTAFLVQVESDDEKKIFGELPAVVESPGKEEEEADESSEKEAVDGASEEEGEAQDEQQKKSGKRKSGGKVNGQAKAKKVRKKRK